MAKRIAKPAWVRSKSTTIAFNTVTGEGGGFGGFGFIRLAEEAGSPFQKKRRVEPGKSCITNSGGLESVSAVSTQRSQMCAAFKSMYRVSICSAE